MDNKTIIAETARQLSADTKTTGRLVEGLALVMKDKSASLCEIAVPGFGRFVAEKTDEHIDVDPATGRRMLMPPAIRLRFAPSSILCKKISDQAK